MCDDSSVVAEEIRPKTLQLIDDGKVVFEGFDQFAFPEKEVSPLLTDNNRLFLDTLAYFLNKYPAKNLTITSFYRSTERNIPYGYFENLGVARAAEIRKMLVDAGIEENRVTLDYGLSEDLFLKEPLVFEAYLLEQPDEFEKIQFTFKNMTFSDANFEFDSDVFNPGEPLKLYADSLKVYLDGNPSKTLTIIGHTDNIGDTKYNLDLGQRRANSAKSYFEQKYQIGPARILVESEGESKPVAPNDTHQNRQKNRRVNFVLQ